VAAFDQCGNAVVCDVNTVMSRSAFPKAMAGYCAVRYTEAGAIMAMVPEMTRRCAHRGGMRGSLCLLNQVSPIF
jgi:hypothetical protein